MKLPESARKFFAAAGAKGGKIGGKVAAANMTAAQRSERARKAVAAREARRKAKGS